MSVTLICPEMSCSERYSISLIDLLTQNGMHVHVLTSNNFDASIAASNNIAHHQVQLSDCDILQRMHLISFWAFKEQSQASIEQFCNMKNSKILIYIARDSDSNFLIERPFNRLSIFCLLSNFHSIPDKTAQKIQYFNFFVATGLLSHKLLKEKFSQKAHLITLIFPKFIEIQTVKELSALDFRRRINIRQDKFIYLLDLNRYIELKSADVVIKAYADLLSDVEFRRATLLIINGLPTQQLQHILSLEQFTPDNVNVFMTYYERSLKRKQDLIENLIGSCNVFIHAVSGGDFDEHAILAQRLGKLIIYSDSDINRKYYPYGIKVKSTQSYFEGINQAFLHIPKVSEVKSAMYSAFDGRSRFSPGTKVKNSLNDLAQKYDRFDEQWRGILKGTVLS